jgi:serine/threonine-protein kinase RsbW
MMSAIPGGASGPGRPDDASGDESTDVTLTGPEDLARMRAAVRRLLGGRGLDEATVEEIVLATQEASKNALSVTKGPDTCASVTLRFAGGEVVVEVLDCGGGFDASCEGLVAASPLDEHGRGIFIMRRFMDTVEVVPRRTGCAVRMTRRPRRVDLTGTDGP